MQQVVIGGLLGPLLILAFSFAKAILFIVSV